MKDLIHFDLRVLTLGHNGSIFELRLRPIPITQVLVRVPPDRLATLVYRKVRVSEPEQLQTIHLKLGERLAARELKKYAVTMHEDEAFGVACDVIRNLCYNNSIHQFPRCLVDLTRPGRFSKASDDFAARDRLGLDKHNRRAFSTSLVSERVAVEAVARALVQQLAKLAVARRQL